MHGNLGPNLYSEPRELRRLRPLFRAYLDFVPYTQLEQLVDGMKYPNEYSLPHAAMPDSTQHICSIRLRHHYVAIFLAIPRVSIICFITLLESRYVGGCCSITLWSLRNPQRKLLVWFLWAHVHVEKHFSRRGPCARCHRRPSKNTTEIPRLLGRDAQLPLCIGVEP